MIARGTPWWLALLWVAAAVGRRNVVRVPALLLAAACTLFFRDPHRRGDDPEAAFVCAADGRVTLVEERDGRWLVSTYLDLLDVHVTRSPCLATVRVRHHRDGAHAPAFRQDAHDNEAVHWDLDSPHGPVVLTQLAGVLARRIVPYVGAGAEVGKGERIGLIRFGSRVDVLLPVGVRPAVSVGQRVTGGRTTLATA